uniref:Uncharacterized protein n=1 Tax=Ascaris lumbricoides TaxID=6252 RepID=A0A0M3HXC3_ASCLU
MNIDLDSETSQPELTANDTSQSTNCLPHQFQLDHHTSQVVEIVVEVVEVVQVVAEVAQRVAEVVIEVVQRVAEIIIEVVELLLKLLLLKLFQLELFDHWLFDAIPIDEDGDVATSLLAEHNANY